MTPNEPTTASDAPGTQPALDRAAPKASRRRLLAAGAVAALAGTTGVVWRLRQDAGAAQDQPDPSMWSLAFDRPQGGTLLMSSLRGRPVVLNFWATWCPPCVEEMPELDRFHRAWQARGWQVVGLAIDNVAAVRRFLDKQPVSFAIGLAGLDGSTLARSLGNDQGGLPYTVVLGGDGGIRQRKAGPTHFEELQGWAASA